MDDPEYWAHELVNRVTNRLVYLEQQADAIKVNMTIGKTIAKAIGHREVEKNIRPIFENLRTALSSDS